MFNPRETPFARWLLFFLFGILSAIHLNIKIPGIDFILFFLLLASFLAYLQKGWYRYWWILALPSHLFFSVFGYILTIENNDLNKESHFQHHTQNECFFIGEVNGMPLKKKWVKLEFIMNSTGTDYEDLKACTGKVLAFIERDSLSETLAHGDQLVFQNPIFKLEPPKNPHSFDYQSFLNYKNIHFQTFIKSGHWRILKKNKSKTISSTALILKMEFLSILRKYLKSDNEFGVGSALILGHKDEISEDIQTAYAGTGATHVLAVSGLHVGIVYLIFQIFLLNRITWFHPIWKVAKVVIPLLGIWSFALLTGMPPSVKRAATMFSIFILGTALTRTKNAYNILAASAFCILFIDPYLIMNVGFQLSYCAVFSILYFQPRIAKQWLIKNKIGNYLWQLSAMSIAAQIGTAPLALFYFHQFPIYFLLSGLIVIPAAFIILNLGLTLFVLESINTEWGFIIGKPLNKLIEIVNQSIFYIQNLPGSIISGIWISGIIAILIYLFIGQLAIAIETKKFKWLVGSLCFLTFISLNHSFSKYQSTQNKKIVVYHINKGSAIDFFDGSELISLTNSEVDQKNLNYAVQNNQWSEGYSNLRTFHFEDSTNHILDRWMYKSDFIQFYDKKFAFIDHPKDTLSNSKIYTNYLIIRNNPKIKIASLKNHYNFGLLIFDASNSRWNIEKWIDESLFLNIPFYNIREKGAFVIDLNQS